LRVARALWNLLLLFEVVLAAVLLISAAVVAAPAADGLPFRDALGNVLLIAAGAGLLSALVVGGLGLGETAVDAKSLLVSVPGKPVVIPAQENPEVLDRRRQGIASRRDKAIALGLMGLAFLGFAALLVVGLWISLAAVLAVLASVGFVLWSTRAARPA